MSFYRSVAATALFFGLACGHALAAHFEICPGERGTLLPVQGSQQLYGFDITAITPRTLSGVVAFDTDKGWYTTSFGPTPLALSPRYRRNSEGWRHDYGVFSTGVLRVNFPTNVTINNWWLLKAGATGDDLGWARMGTVTCSPDIPPNVVLPENRMLLDDSVASQFERALLPSDPVLQAVSIDPLEPATACATPFRDAAVKLDPLPRMSSSAMLAQPGWVTIEILIPPDGHVPQSAVYISSGSEQFDATLERWIQASQFSPKIAYCQPVASIYLYQIHVR